MVGTLASSDQDIDAGVTTLSNRARFWLLTVAALDVLLVISSMVALNAALPDIALQTAATQTQLTWIIDGYTLVLACLLLPAGTMGDRFGRRGALLVGPAIFAIASLSPTLFDSPAQIIVARAIAGVGAAFIMPATLSLLTAAFPKSERNKAVGVWAGVASSGAIFGFMGTGLLLKFFSWQSIFYGFAAAASACSSARARSRRRATKPRHLSTGSERCSSAAPSRFSCSASWKRRCTAGRIRLSGAACRPVFCSPVSSRWSSCGASTPYFATGSVGITFLFFANFGFFFVSMQYMQLILGYSPLQTAFALTPLAIPIMVLGATMHLYLPKVGLRIAVALGLFLIGAGLFCMRTLDAGSTYLNLVWPFLITPASVCALRRRLRRS